MATETTIIEAPTRPAFRSREVTVSDMVQVTNGGYDNARKGIGTGRGQVVREQLLAMFAHVSANPEALDANAMVMLGLLAEDIAFTKVLGEPLS